MTSQIPGQIPGQIPIVDYLVLDGEPHLRAHECRRCQALYFDRRNACGRCGTVEFGTRDLANTGTVRAFTIVRRASPKVRTPYISAIGLRRSSCRTGSWPPSTRTSGGAR
jgi:uncharacterized OB-fold protein